MTKPPHMKPEPSADTGYDSYVWPRSKTPEKDALYTVLHDAGWRYDTTSVTFHTPEGQPHQFGRLEYAPDYRWAKIVGPSVKDETLDPPYRRPEPILELVRLDDEGWVIK